MYTTIVNELINNISPLLIDKKFILIGENHGVTENATFLELFVTNIQLIKKVTYVGFEYPSFCFSDFFKAVTTDNFELIRNLPVTQLLINDGRFSLAHFNLLKYLYLQNIQFTFYDSGVGSWDNRDSVMYENIRKIRIDNDSVVIIVAGNIHTSLHLLTIDKKDYKPLGSYFKKEELILINLRYHSGEFYNFGRKSFENTKMPENQTALVNNNQVLYHFKKATPTK